MKPPSIALPFTVACLGIALFVVMDALMKALTLQIGSYNAAMWRSIAGSLMMGVVRFSRERSLPSGDVMQLHALRGMQVAFMIVLYFWGLARVPLAEGIAITFIAPLVALYLAAVLLKERVTPRAIGGSLLGFAGVLVIALGRIDARPTGDVVWGVSAIIIAALFYAHNLILQRQQAQVAPPLDVAFFNALFVNIALLALAPLWLKVPPLASVPLILVAAVIGSFSVMLLAWAYARAEAKILITVEYTAFIWAALIGTSVFHEALTGFTLGGTVLIVAGCILAAWQERSHQPGAELGA